MAPRAPQTGFSISFRGYNRSEVNSFIEQNDAKYAAAIRRAEEEKQRTERDLGRKLEVAEKRIEELEADLSAQREKLSIVKSVAEKDKSAAEERTSALEGELSAVTAERDKLKAETDALKSRLIEMASENIRLQNRLIGAPDSDPRKPESKAALMAQIKKLLGDLLDDNK